MKSNWSKDAHFQVKDEKVLGSNVQHVAVVNHTVLCTWNLLSG